MTRSFRARRLNWYLCFAGVTLTALLLTGVARPGHGAGNDPHWQSLVSRFPKLTPRPTFWDNFRLRPVVEIFRGVKTPVEFINGEPCITVYRGIRGAYNPSETSARFGDHVFFTLSKSVAHRYALTDLPFMRLHDVDTPRGKVLGRFPATVVALKLPLSKAFIAKHDQSQGRRITKDDDLYRVLDPHFDTLGFIKGTNPAATWDAPRRLQELELVFKLSELGGSLEKYQVKVDVTP
jgi:hypothetical protein